MKKNLSPFCITAFLFCVLASCNMATPENYFDQAVLNTNMMTGFANNGLQRELESTPAKLVAGTTDKTEPMKRKEVIADKISFLEDAFTKIKALKKTDETKKMLQASIALYEYVLPVYKTDYMKLAALYDGNGSREEIKSFSNSIAVKYFPGFSARMDTLIDAGKIYATAHQIKVNWDVKTSPDLH